MQQKAFNQCAITSDNNTKEDTRIEKRMKHRERGREGEKKMARST